MAEIPAENEKKYTVHNFDAVNSHVDEVVERDQDITKLKKARINNLRARNIAIMLLSVGVTALLLGFAYKIINSFGNAVVEPWMSTRIEYIKVPDPEVSQVIEKPIYIEKPTFIPVEIPVKEGVVTNFTVFQHRVVGVNGIDKVVTGSAYPSSDSRYPSNQWCYATGNKSENSYITVTIGNKEGRESVIWSTVVDSDATRLGSTVSALNDAKIYCEFIEGPPPKEDEIEWDTSKPHEKPTNKTGTGFFVNESGYLVTNNHVIEQCNDLYFKLDGKYLPVTLVSSDDKADLAVLKIQKGLVSSYAMFSDSTRTGEDVAALGYPLGDDLGEDIKVTTGNISAMVGLKGDPDYLQFTAPIQSGNSGGPLLSSYGGVVGINTAALQGEQFQNVNFAIKGTKAQSFLSKNHINFKVTNAREEKSAADLVEYAQKFTGQVYCYAQ